MPFFTVKDGRIQATKFEYNLVLHCNFSCSDCSQNSPYSSVQLSSLAAFRRDLSALSKVYRAGRFRFVGGEPFLQKNLLDYVLAVRESGIADQIEICTNGSLIDKVDDRIFKEVDLVSVSWYPDSRCDETKVTLAIRKCLANGSRAKVRRISRFRAMNLDEPNGDGALTENIYKSCQMAHSWHCQTFKDGYFYLCSRPILTGEYLKRLGHDPPDFRAVDGVYLHEGKLFERLQALLSRKDPIKSCRYCLGTVGKELPWRQLSVLERRSPPALARNPRKMINAWRMNYLLVLASLERALLRVFPSLRLFRAVILLKNLTTGD